MKKLGFGMMRLPLLNEEDKKSIDKKTVCQMVDTFMERGFTYFDTAYMYHEYESERAMKDVLVTRKDRDSYTLASKLPVMQLKEKRRIILSHGPVFKVIERDISSAFLH